MVIKFVINWRLHINVLLNYKGYKYRFLFAVLIFLSFIFCFYLNVVVCICNFYLIS